MEVHSRHVDWRWKRLSQLQEAEYVKRRSCRAHWTKGWYHHGVGRVLTENVEQYHNKCQTLKYTVWKYELGLTYQHSEAVILMAVLCSLVIVTRVWIKSRCPKWRTTVNRIRCKALDYTICWLDDDTVVILRNAVVELRSFGSLKHKNITKLDSECINANKPQKKHTKMI